MNTSLITEIIVDLDAFLLKTAKRPPTDRQANELFLKIKKALIPLLIEETSNFKTHKKILKLSEKIDSINQKIVPHKGLISRLLSMPQAVARTDYLTLRATVDILIERSIYYPLFTKTLTNAGKACEDEEKIKQKLADNLAEEFTTKGNNHTLQSLNALANTPKRKTNLHKNLLLLFAEGYFKSPPLPFYFEGRLYLLDKQNATKFSQLPSTMTTLEEIPHLGKGIFTQQELDAYIACAESTKRPGIIEDWPSIGKVAHFVGDKEIARRFAAYAEQKAPATTEEWLSLGQAAYFFDNTVVPERFAAFIDQKVLEARRAFRNRAKNIHERLSHFERRSDTTLNYHKEKLFDKCIADLLPIISFTNKDYKYLARNGFSGIFARLAAISFFILEKRYSRSTLREGENIEERIARLKELTAGTPESKAVEILDTFRKSRVSPYPKTKNFFRGLNIEAIVKLLPNRPHLMFLNGYKEDYDPYLPECMYPFTNYASQTKHFRRKKYLNISSLRDLNIQSYKLTDESKEKTDTTSWCFEVFKEKKFTVQFPSNTLQGVKIYSYENSLEEALRILSRMQSLRSIHIQTRQKKPEEMSPEIAATLSHLPHLVHLALLSLSVESRPLKYSLSTPLPNIRKLSLGGYVINKGVIEGSEILTMLKLKKSYITNLQEIKTLSYLEHLELHSCFNNDVQNLKPLSFDNIAEELSSDSLKTLLLICKVSEDTNETETKNFLENFPKLETLKIGGNEIKSLLLQLKSNSLMHLVIYNTPEEGENAFSSIELDKLYKNFPKLKSLSLQKKHI